MNGDGADIIFFHGVDCHKGCKGIVEKQHTLLTDLQQDADVIFSKLRKSYRRDIRHALDENIDFVAIDSSEMKKDPKILEAFKKEYDRFTKAKGIANSYNTAAVKQYIESGNLILTKVFSKDTNYAQQLDLVDGKTIRGLYSVSNFRDTGLDPGFIGRANKLLQWREIEYFKNNGYKTLDWGGISSFETPNGVDRFKLGFAGEKHSYYNFIAGVSLIGKLAVWLIKLMKINLYDVNKNRGAFNPIEAKIKNNKKMTYY